MSFRITLDFCIVRNPFSPDKRDHIIFFTRKGSLTLEPEAKEDVDYNQLVTFIANLGYAETDNLTFEHIGEPSFPRPTTKEIRKILEDSGASYNKELEIRIKNDFKKLKENFEMFQQESIRLDNLHKEEVEFEKRPIKIYPKNKVHKIPGIGETVTLNFYLFLECRFVDEEDYVLNFRGDFYSKTNKFNKNYLKATRSEFVRIENPNSNSILLQSNKTSSDFVKEIDPLFEGFFELMPQPSNPALVFAMRPKKYVFSFIEISDKLNSDDKIVVDIQAERFYDEMMDLSDKIEKEIKKEESKSIKKIELISKIKRIRKGLKIRIETFAKNDEFERAAMFKNKLNLVNKLYKDLQTEEKEIVLKKKYNELIDLKSSL